MVEDEINAPIALGAFRDNSNNNNNKVYLHSACPYINTFALGTLQKELRQNVKIHYVAGGLCELS